jgi:protein-disulfide isomerase
MGLATEAAWCAQDQGKFFDYQHILYENQGMSFNQNSLTQLAVKVGLDEHAFVQCLSSGQHQTDVEQARQAANSRGVGSTPTFFINNRRIRGNEPYETFKRIVEQELAAAQ